MENGKLFLYQILSPPHAADDIMVFEKQSLTMDLHHEHIGSQSHLLHL